MASNQLTKIGVVVGAVEPNILHIVSLVLLVLSNHCVKVAVYNLLIHRVNVSIDPFTGFSTSSFHTNVASLFNAFSLLGRAKVTYLKRKVHRLVKL